MKLTQLFGHLSYEGTFPESAEVDGLAYDSRKAGPGIAFACLVGANVDGHRFVLSAYEKGCRVFVVCRAVSLPEDAVVIRVQDTRYALAVLSDTLFGHPSGQVKVIGVTGTKGKTTVTHLIRAVLEEAGVKTGIIGTNGIRYGDVYHETVNTTPESYELQKALREMADAGCRCAAVEVSSQGLMTERTACVDFAAGVFTNISPDHIGPTEHPDFAHYLECKSRLFKVCRAGFVNTDDPHSRVILNAAECGVTTFGMEHRADYQASGVQLLREPGFLGLTFRCKSHSGERMVKLNQPGTFSACNALAAIAVCRHLGVEWDVIVRALSKAAIKGRVEVVPALPYCTTVVDYAHNGVSLQSLLTTLRAYQPRRLVCVFGSVGGRTQGRRAEMGGIAAKLADFSVLTSDNPGFEEPMDIIRDIEASMASARGKFVSIPDREAAVKYAIDNARPGDILAIAGKGHEEYQLIGDRHVPYSDRECALRFGRLRLEREGAAAKPDERQSMAEQPVFQPEEGQNQR